ncbi:MAG: nitrous oxide-stimulated promoter family protein [Isosphaeraceae bacterium]
MQAAASEKSPRIQREKRTIEVMIGIYCRGRHGQGRPCSECRELLDYAHCRLDRCPFGERKPTCVNCPIHCYRQAMRDRIKEVMRYAGARMLTRHPILAVLHLLDGRRSRLRNDVL